MQRFPRLSFAAVIVVWAGALSVIKALLDHGVGAEEIALAGVKGPLIVLGAPLTFALYNVLLKPLLGRYDLLALTAASSLAGTLALLPLLRPSHLANATSISAGDLALVLYLGILSTFLGYVAWNIGLKAFGPTRAVTTTYGDPGDPGDRRPDRCGDARGARDGVDRRRRAPDRRRCRCC